MMNPQELKNLFKLDPKVEAKLAKLKWFILHNH